MKRRTFVALETALLAFAALAYAADVWNAKDYTQWTAEELARILNDSPWARPANIAFDLPGMQSESPRARTTPGEGGYNGGPYPRRGRYPDENDGPRDPRGLPSFVATIRWESALPIQQALLRSQAVQTVDQSEKQYVIAVLGLPLPGGAGGNQAELVREELLALTRILRKGKAPIAPSSVNIDASKAAGEVRFFFPRTQPISVDDKEVTFETQLGKMKLMQKFRLKDMAYKGKLEL